uniref:Ankyrin-1 n=1 Tax=Magallana gigas TaxID=29159 RepID=K1PAK1_MAGGI|eukprot:XP_019922345.1 PREDICTED: ankyrin-1-like [Crassostrea gigas]
MACEKVERNIKSRNLVIVYGHSGSGKSAIIQHIALKYREHGWTVRRVKGVEDIVNIFYSGRFQKDKTICVFNDPLGKECFDEIYNDSWQRYEEDLKLFLKTAKILMSCRNHILSDSRVARYLVNQSAIVDIDNEIYKLSVEEKRHILTKYTLSMNLSDEDCNKIVEVERYFPLLCSLCSSKEKYISKGIRFFTEPVTVLKEEIIEFKEKDRGKYCALALLVLFNDDLCVSDLLKNKDNENKFKQMLKLCGLSESTPSTAIGNNLDSVRDCFVKMIGDRFHFYHDLVMEVTTHVFGTDYPTETIRYADIGFLRKKVRLGNCEKYMEPFTIYLSDKYIEELGERLFTELFGNRLIDVALNPCLKNEKVIETLKKIIQKHPEKLPMILEKKKLKYEKQNYYTAKHLTKIAFMSLENDLSPLYVLIVYSHTDLSRECLNTLTRMHIKFKSSSLLPAVYCNGSMQLFHLFPSFHVKESLTNVLRGFSPIHIVSAFHNYDILEELIMIGGDVNSISNTWDHFTPLLLAASNDTQDYKYYFYGRRVAHRREITVQLLLDNGAYINLCDKDGASPLYMACQNGYDRTVELLLDNGADINLCDEDGASPLYISCQNGHDSTVQLLLDNGADINLCDKDGASPLYIACQNGYDRTVRLLLSNGADINLCASDGGSPLYIACQNGYDRTVRLLLSNGADINLCMEAGASPLYISCQNGHDRTVRLLLSNGADINLCANDGGSPLYIACQNGYDRTVRLLLSNGADMNLCANDGASPLYISCQNGHDSTAQLLLSNGANITLCDEDGASPLYISCQNGHDSTAQLLLSNGADIELCAKKRTSSLYIACQKGHDSTVQLLLSNGADINLCDEDGASPLYIACQNGHDSTVQLLLRNGADTYLCDKDGTSPLYIACQKGYHGTVKRLLSNGADINLCNKNGASPLYIACRNLNFFAVEHLLSKGADINLCDKDGASPLYIACQNGQLIIAQLLLNNGADINFCNKNGASPLYIACQNGQITLYNFY